MRERERERERESEEVGFVGVKIDSVTIGLFMGPGNRGFKVREKWFSGRVMYCGKVVYICMCL